MPPQLHSTWIRLLTKLTRYVDSRVSVATDHSAQVAKWASITAPELGCTPEETRALYWAALFHDVGKIGVPEHILTKPSPLSRDEWLVMKTHPVIGASIVKSMNHISESAQIIYSHQEKYDGAGYPEGIRGEAIPLGGRILAVLDAYDAMTNDRVYRNAITIKDAVAELRDRKGSDFDPAIVDVFVGIVTRY